MPFRAKTTGSAPARADELPQRPFNLQAARRRSGSEISCARPSADSGGFVYRHVPSDIRPSRHPTTRQEMASRPHVHHGPRSTGYQTSCRHLSIRMADRGGCSDRANPTAGAGRYAAFSSDGAVPRPKRAVLASSAPSLQELISSARDPCCLSSANGRLGCRDINHECWE